MRNASICVEWLTRDFSPRWKFRVSFYKNKQTKRQAKYLTAHSVSSRHEDRSEEVMGTW